MWMLLLLLLLASGGRGGKAKPVKRHVDHQEVLDRLDAGHSAMFASLNEITILSQNTMDEMMKLYADVKKAEAA